MGDEFHERLNSQLTGLDPTQCQRALAEETGAVLRASVAAGTDDWRQLWALLRGLALTALPKDTESETAKQARARFPDIKDPYATALSEAGQAAKLLADRGSASDIGHPADGCRAAGDPLVACDAYSSRFLLVAPFGYDGEAPDHWYAWDVDSCWILTVTGAGLFGSAEDALAEWQHAVGPAAGTALSPSPPETAARLLAPCLETGSLSDILQGSEPRTVPAHAHGMHPDGRATAAAGIRMLQARLHRVAEAGRLRVTERRAAGLIHAVGTGVVFTLIDQAEDERDETLPDTAWESVCAAILTDAGAAAIAGPAAAAVTLRVALPDLTALTTAERALLGDWLDRIAESQHVPR